jgi:hypothetical protein
MFRWSFLAAAGLAVLTACDQSPVAPPLQRSSVQHSVSASSSDLLGCGTLLVERHGGAITVTPKPADGCPTVMQGQTVSVVETGGEGAFKDVVIAMRVKNASTTPYRNVSVSLDLTGIQVIEPAGLASKDVIVFGAGADVASIDAVLSGGESSDERTFTFGLHAGVRSATINYEIHGAPAFPAWCNTSLNFDGNALPAGWDMEVIRGGPGIANDRLEGRPLDSGSWITTMGALPASTTEVEVNYDASNPFSTFGIHHGPDLMSAAGFTEYHDVNASYNFGANNMRLQIGPSGAQPDIQTNVPFDYGDFHYRVIIRSTGAEWTVTRLSDSSELVHVILPYTTLNLADVTGFRFFNYVTTDNTTWTDNLSIACR